MANRNRQPSAILSKLGISDLVKLHLHENEWYVRQARQQLAERATSGPDFEAARTQLRSLFEQQTDPVKQLRALCSLYVIGGADETFLRAQLHHPDEHIRVWAIRFLSDLWPLDTVISERPAHAPAHVDQGLLDDFVQVAKSDPVQSGSPRTRFVAATIARIAACGTCSATRRTSRQCTRPQPAALDLVWPDPRRQRGSNFAGKTCRRLPIATDKKVHRPTSRRGYREQPSSTKCAADAGVEQANRVSSRTLSPVLSEALRGWSKAKKPAAWDALQSQVSKSNDSKLRNRVRDLSVLFGDGRALDEVKRVALDDKVELAQRQAALETLIANKPPDLRQICERLLTRAIPEYRRHSRPGAIRRPGHRRKTDRQLPSVSRVGTRRSPRHINLTTHVRPFAAQANGRRRDSASRRHAVLRAPHSQLQRSRSSRPNSPKCGANCATAHPTNESRLRVGKQNSRPQSSPPATKATVARCSTRPAHPATCSTATATTPAST